MYTSLSDMIGYLKDEEFIKIENLNEFPEIGKEEKYILQNFGLPTYELGSIPTIVSDGKLKRYAKGLIELGVGPVGSKYLLDTTSRKILFCMKDDPELDPVNFSLYKFFACKYTLRWFEGEIESKQKFGSFFSNAKKYAEVLREMLMKADPGIEHYVLWQEILLEKELGVN